MIFFTFVPALRHMNWGGAKKISLLTKDLNKLPLLLAAEYWKLLIKGYTDLHGIDFSKEALNHFELNNPDAIKSVTLYQDFFQRFLIIANRFPRFICILCCWKSTVYRKAIVDFLDVFIFWAAELEIHVFSIVVRGRVLGTLFHWFYVNVGSVF